MLSRHPAVFAAFLGLGLSVTGVAAPQVPWSAPAPEVRSATPPSDNRLGDAFVVSKPTGISRQGDELHGFGPGYALRFAAGAFELAPAVTQARQEVTLGFRLVSTGRRGGHSHPAAPATTTVDGETVCYTRPRVVETYDVRSDGVKQSFVFNQLPPGSGDLVVRGRIDTELPLARATEREVLFETPGFAGVRIGAVTGIDARGATAPGTLRLRNRVLEMSLPASFVNRAVLPLVLDPLVSPSILLPSGGSVLWDVAYNAQTDRYAVIRGDLYYSTYQYVLGNGTLGQRAAVVQTLGPTFGTASVLTSGSRFWVVGLGNVFGGGRYPWYGVLGSGSVNPLYGYGGSYGATAMGGQAGPQDGTIVVTTSGGNVLVSGLGGTPFSLGRGTAIAISRSGGGKGRYLVTWSAGGDIFGAIVDSRLAVLVPRFRIADDSGHVETDPSVDGDGTNWLVAYTFGWSSSDTDIHCRGVTYDPRSGTAYLTPERTIIAKDLHHELGPSVAWVGDSYLIGYADETQTPDYDIYVKSLESFDCTVCEGLFAVDVSPAVARNVRIASQRAGGGGDEALIVWQQGGGILARRFRAQDGSVTDLGGGCGLGGRASATCGRRTAPAFGLRVQHAAPSSPAWLMIGLSRANFPCGPCTLVPNPLAALAMTTDARGDARVTTALGNEPALLGLKLLTQWLVAAAPGACGSQLSFSNALEVEIQ